MISLRARRGFKDHIGALAIHPVNNITLAVGDKVDFVLDSYGNLDGVYSNFTGQISTVPEPGLLALLAVGGLVVFKRRRA